MYTQKKSLKRFLMPIGLLVLGAIISTPMMALAKKVPVVGPKLNDLRDQANDINVG